MKTTVTLQEGMHFSAELNGHTFSIDAPESSGGQDKGPRPKPLMLTALAGCTAMDVIWLLRKMRAEPERFSVEVESELSETDPKVFTHATITYRLSGGAVTQEKAEKAAAMSQKNMCGVTTMLKATMPVDYKVIVE